MVRDEQYEHGYYPQMIRDQQGEHVETDLVHRLANAEEDEMLYLFRLPVLLDSLWIEIVFLIMRRRTPTFITP